VLSCALAVLALLPLRPAIGADEADGAPRPAPEIMKVSEVRAGMRGYGLTTFQGARIERFEVEVLGVLNGWAPQGHIVLIAMSGIGLEETGTVAGMSGSPIYIDGKLLGAVAYGFYFCKIPLSGVTPAEEMLVALDIDRQGSESDRPARKAARRLDLQARSRRVLEQIRSGATAPPEARRAALLRMTLPPCIAPPATTWPADQMPQSVRSMLGGAPAAGMSLLPAPLMIGGLRPEAFTELTGMLGEVGLFPVQAAPVSGVAGDAEQIPLAPGAPVGYVWVSGDLDISGMGTLTMLDGDRVLAFGHPLLGTGESDFPLALGRVQTVVPSLQHSFRLSSADRIIGRLTQDRDSAIVGRIGERSPMLPCTVTVRGVQEVTYRYEVAQYWEMVPLLAFFVTSASAERWEGYGNLFTVTGKATIRLKDRPEPIVLENVHCSMDPAYPAFELVWMPLEALVLNPFQEVELESVDVDMTVTPGLSAARIESVRAERNEVEPGETLGISVTLLQFQGGEHVRRLELEVPREAKPGSALNILVGDARTRALMDMSADPGLFNPRDMAGLIEALEHLPRNTGLFAHGSFVSTGVRYEGVPMPDLPGSVLHMMGRGTQSGVVTPLRGDVRTQIDTPWVVSGSRSISVTIKDPDRGISAAP